MSVYCEDKNQIMHVGLYTQWCQELQVWTVRVKHLHREFIAATAFHNQLQVKVNSQLAGQPQSTSSTIHGTRISPTTSCFQLWQDMLLQ